MWILKLEGKEIARWEGDLPRDQIPDVAKRHCVNLFDLYDYRLVRRTGKPLQWMCSGNCELSLSEGDIDEGRTESNV